MDCRCAAKFLFVFLFGILFFASLSWCRTSIPVTITVDESKIIRKIPKELFGFNHNWIQSERLVWDKRTDQVSSEFLKTLAGLPMPLNRMSGSVSQIFHWKETIGPVEGRIAQQLAPYDLKGKKYFGPLEWIESTRKIDPEAEFSWVFNMKTETPADHADLVEFLTSDGVGNPNGGINWGAKRVEYGLPDPVPVKIWELGNEMDWAGGKFGWSLENYISECTKIIKAVRSVDPKAAIAVHVATAPMGRQYRFKDWRKWHRTVLKELGQQIDYVVFHAYYYSNVPISIYEKYIDVVRDDILNITGSNRIKIYISEHAVWPAKPKAREKQWKANWYKTHSLSGCLLTAQFINRLLQREEVECAAYHSFSGGPWGVFFSGKDGKLNPTGIFDLFTALNSSLGSSVVASSVHGLRTDVHRRSLTFTVTAMASKKGLNLIMVNREAKADRTVTFQFDANYILVEMTTVSAETLESYNTEYVRKIYTKTEILNTGEVFREFVMPAKSIVTMKLVRWGSGKGIHR